MGWYLGPGLGQVGPWPLALCLCLCLSLLLHAPCGAVALETAHRHAAVLQAGTEAEAESEAGLSSSSEILPVGRMVLHVQVVVCPDNPVSGTADSMNIKLTGSTAVMSDPVPFAAGFTTGQILDLNVVCVDPGAITEMALQLGGAVPAPGDPALLEVLSFDSMYGFKEDGSKRYTNFGNPEDLEVNMDDELILKPTSGYVVIVRTSSFEHAGTSNAISIKFLGTDSSSEVLELSGNGFDNSESRVVTLESDNPIVTNIVQIELGIDFKTDDLWMVDMIQVYTPYQRVVFHNSGVQFIGFKPYVIASDSEKLRLIKNNERPY